MKQQRMIDWCLRSISCVLLLTVLFSGVGFAEETIKVGAIFPLSGPIAVYGEGFLKAVTLAIDDINAKGGVNGKSLELVYEDGKGTAQDSISALRKLINIHKLPVVFGPAASSNFLAVAPVAEENKTVLIGAESAAPAITDAGEYIFRVFPSDKLQGKGLAKLALDLGYQEVALMYINNDWGVGLKGVFVEDFTKAGGTILEEVPFDEGKTDYRTELLKIAKQQPKAVVCPIYVQEAAVLFKQAYQLGITSKWLTGSAAKNAKLIELAGEAAEGIIGTYPTYPQATPEHQYFEKLWREKYNTDPAIFTAFNWDMVHITAKAIEAGGYTADGIREALYKVSKGYKGATGDKTFDENGDVGSEYGAWTIKDGKIVDYQY
jgi:branched-chain amino acid transport system substrate-binding protein